jgi:alkanesulfonate monooxygenase SsuD/methylene tetrahydromethanopterin reductase-like flavin-dependent oxidoreductase (luciferase family)
LRLGYGVRLMPFPYNHPVRSAESAAVLDLLSDGRVEFGTGRSSTRAELEGFGIDPHRTRELWEEALDVVVAAWTQDVLEWNGKAFKIPPRRVLPKPLQDPHPPLWGATSSPDSHRIMGEKGMGLLSFTIGTPPEELKQRIDMYRDGLTRAKPVGKFVNGRAATFTLVNVAPTRAEARATAAESFEWYARRGTEAVALRVQMDAGARPGVRGRTPTATCSPISTRVSSPSTSSSRAAPASWVSRRRASR